MRNDATKYPTPTLPQLQEQLPLEWKDFSGGDGFMAMVELALPLGGLYIVALFEVHNEENGWHWAAEMNAESGAPEDVRRTDPAETWEEALRQLQPIVSETLEEIHELAGFTLGALNRRTSTDGRGTTRHLAS